MMAPGRHVAPPDSAFVRCGARLLYAARHTHTLLSLAVGYTRYKPQRCWTPSLVRTAKYKVVARQWRRRLRDGWLRLERRATSHIGHSASTRVWYATYDNMSATRNQTSHRLTRTQQIYAFNSYLVARNGRIDHRPNRCHILFRLNGAVFIATHLANTTIVLTGFIWVGLVIS